MLSSAYVELLSELCLVATGLLVKSYEHWEGKRVLCARAAQLRKATTWSILERTATWQRPLALLRQVRPAPVLESLLIPYALGLYADSCSCPCYYNFSRVVMPSDRFPRHLRRPLIKRSCMPNPFDIQGLFACCAGGLSGVRCNNSDMQSKPPTTQVDLFSNLPGWHELSAQEKAKLISIIQNPATFSQLLAFQQAMFSSNTSGQVQRQAETIQTSSTARHLPGGFRESQLLFNGQGTSHLARPTASLPTFSGLNRELPSPPQLDRSLLRAPLPFWVARTGGNGPASLLAANTSATQQSRSSLQQPSPPLTNFGSDLFRNTSLGSRYLNSPLPAELSLRASSMPGSFQDIAARLHLNRAGINTATASMIPVLSQDWLVIPFGTAQQLLPVYAGDVLANDNGDAVMLIDEKGRNWPMKCSYSRYGEAPRLTLFLFSNNCVLTTGDLQCDTEAALHM